MGSFASRADCRLPGSSGHPSSLSERNGLQAPQPPALVTVEAPLAADILGCPDERVNDGPPDGRFWDSAAIEGQDNQHDNHVGPRRFLPWAALDRFCLVSEVLRLLDRLLGAESETIAGPGHFCMEEAPDAINAPSAAGCRADLHPQGLVR